MTLAPSAARFLGALAATLSLTAGPAPSQVGLQAFDPLLEDGSDSVFELVRGRTAELRASGPAGDALLILASPTPPPANPPVIGGVPLAVDPATALLLGSGQLGQDGAFTRVLQIPAGAPLGGRVYIQILAASPIDGALALSNGLELTVVDAFVFDFQADPEGWIGGFADYPVGAEAAYGLDWGHSTLPPPLDTTHGALRIEGVNHSDDLFMFVKRRVEGLVPDRTYTLLFDLSIGSTYPEDSPGVGGSPGSSVFLKAGATRKEPAAIVVDGMQRMNLDKGNQSQDGSDMHLLGHIGIPSPHPQPPQWTIIERDHREEPFVVKADDTGRLWLCIGTDSGYEGHTRLYYERVVVKLY